MQAASAYFTIDSSPSGYAEDHSDLQAAGNAALASALEAATSGGSALAVFWRTLGAAFSLMGVARLARRRQYAARMLEIQAAQETVAEETSVESAQELPEAASQLDHLREALARNPRRGDIRLELARQLYEAGEAQEFLKVALPLEEMLHEESWERVRAMGHQLLPREYRFFPRVIEAESPSQEFAHLPAEIDELSQRRMSTRAARR